MGFKLIKVFKFSLGYLEILVELVSEEVCRFELINCLFIEMLL